MRRKLITLAVTAAMTLTAAAFSVSAVSAADAGAGVFDGKTCVEASLTGASSVDYVLAKYQHAAVFDGPGQCWGYAEKVGDTIARKRTTVYYDDFAFNKENFIEKCLGVKAGTHIRFGRQPVFDGGRGHSVVLFKVTEEQVCWGDNNYQWDNTISYHTGTLDEFLYYYDQYGYINMITETSTYKLSDQTEVAVSPAAEGVAKLTWLRTSGTSRYDVYRSDSLNGPYTRIAKVKSRSYTDTSAELGKTVYYRVRSIKSSGSINSASVGFISRLAVPELTVGNNQQTGAIVLRWQSVPGADKYYLYRYNDETGTYRRITTKTGNQYTDKIASESGKSYAYKIKAVNSKNPSAESDFSSAVWGYRW